MDSIELGNLMHRISGVWKFTGTNYRGFDELDERQQQLFPLEHSILHVGKSLGALCTQAEKADHGDPLDEQQVRIATAKLLATTLNLASHLKMTPEKLVDLIETALR